MNPVIDTRLASRQTTFREIPIIDIGTLVDGSNPQAVADQIRHVCEHVGFMYIQNHGVPQALIERMYGMTRAFFALPPAVKEKLHVMYSGQTMRGYIPFYAENVDPGNTRDFKECFDFGEHEDTVSPFFGPNLMPDELPGFRQCCEDYHAVMMTLARKLVSAIALSLDLPADYFSALQRKPVTIQRLLHYPPQTGSVSQEEIGIGAHTDYGFLTILSQDQVGGLQVRNRAGEWVSAPPVEGTFIVNIGDLVQTFTNDRYLSTMHRVINNTGAERYSVPFFLDLDFNAVVEPVPTCVSTENPARYTPYTCGAHKYERFSASYRHLQAVPQGG
ncbi:MAG: isopenicillin N synthase family oxygenase [Thiothrix sp.]|nr:isopenicillin N synthase family oxygenase [Thiothrix sp.]HPE60871.1 2-oxoglutarate and iron-dependent oxygenase domain-containing protein [Thiolinea sp.]